MSCHDVSPRRRPRYQRQLVALDKATNLRDAERAERLPALQTSFKTRLQELKTMVTIVLDGWQLEPPSVDDVTPEVMKSLPVAGDPGVSRTMQTVLGAIVLKSGTAMVQSSEKLPLGQEAMFPNPNNFRDAEGYGPGHTYYETLTGLEVLKSDPRYAVYDSAKATKTAEVNGEVAVDMHKYDAGYNTVMETEANIKGLRELDQIYAEASQAKLTGDAEALEYVANYLKGKGFSCNKCRKDILGPRFHKAGEDHDLCKTDFEMLAPEEQKKYEVILEPGAEPVSPRHAASKLDDELLATATDPTSLQFVVRARWAASLVSIAIYVLVSRLLLDNECPCTVIPGPVKQVERMVFKSGVRYGLDFRKCKDLARLTIQVANLAVAAMALRLLLASGLFVIVNHKHRFAANYPVITVGGYRDYQLICLIRIGGVWRVCELQINLEIFVEIKQTSHGPFEVARTLEAFSAANTQYKGDLQPHVLEKVQNGVLLSLDMTGQDKLTAAQFEQLVQALVHDTSRLQELVSVPSLHPDVQRQP